jgi:transcriptional regulator with XRE-family HTH domain
MGQLWDLVQAYIDRHGTSERQLAKRLGYSSSGVFSNWREPRQLPSAQALARFAGLSGTPYQRVLDAALTDAGYLPEPLITDDAIQLRRTPSGRRTRGQLRAVESPAGEESQDVDGS